MSRLISFLGALILAISALFPLASPVAAQPSITLTPSVGPPGTQITLSPAEVQQLGGLGPCISGSAQTAGGGVFEGQAGTAGKFSTTNLSNGGATFRVPQVPPGLYYVFFYTCAGMSGNPDTGQGVYATFSVPTNPDAISPATGTYGSAFRIVGSGFGASQGTVTFCDCSIGGPPTPAKIISWSDTSIWGTVPTMQAGGAQVTVQTSQGYSIAVGDFQIDVGPTPLPPVTLPQCGLVLTIGAPEVDNIGGHYFSLPVPPEIQSSRTFVPLDLFKEQGDLITWSGATRQVGIKQGATDIVLTIGSTGYTVNGQNQEMDVAPFIQDPGYTMVPVSFIDNALGLVTSWVPLSRQVVIDTGCG
ncbi:MAG: stalk domain-containing protein [Thermaerobacter sp.]|jgi:hypothetical protein|nr:stalk domain-containing protein [Thermaerobacter sp.]